MEKKIYFSGDSGYFDEFKKIGENYGPFDFAFIENGQYNKNWQPIHMLPNETVQAAIDVKADRFMSIHNSKYVLALHSWYEPLDSVWNQSQKKGVKMITPMIGQTFTLNEELSTNRWWKKYIKKK